MVIYLTDFQKNENSTAVPSGTMNQFNGQIKSDCSIHNPVITFDLFAIADNDIAKFNYAYIPEFHRYYWITDISWSRGYWDISMSIDVLASYRAAIGNATLYVLRAASDYNGNIIDNLYPVKTGCDFSIAHLAQQWLIGGREPNGYYVVGVTSKYSRYGAIQYYCMTYTNMQTFMERLMDDTITTANGFDIADASLQLQKSIIDPISYIKSCTYVPMAIPTAQLDAVTSIEIFGYTLNVNAYIPRLPVITHTYTFTRPTHPDTNSRGNYVNCSPYTLLTLQIPPFGIIELDTSVTCNVAAIDAVITMDITNGTATLEVVAGSESGGSNPVIINAVKAQVGIPLQLSQVTKDYIGGAMSILGGIGSMLKGDFLGVAAGIGSAIGSVAPRVTSVGTNGDFGGLYSVGDWQLIAQFFRPVDDDLSHHGRPLCAMRKINTLTGYVIVQDGDVPLLDATKQEQLEVKNYLESGFYYQ